MWLACCVGSDVVVTGCFEKVKHRHAVAVWGNKTQNVTHSFSLLQPMLCFFSFAYAIMLMTTQGPCQLWISFKTACSKPQIVSKTTQLWPQHPHDGHVSSKKDVLLTHRADDQPNGHRSTSPVDQFEWKGFGTACWQISKVQTARSAYFNLRKKKKKSIWLWTE